MAGGRPSTYSEELASDICAHLMNGLSMMDIERLDGMPTRYTIYNWMAKDADFSTRIARAREVQGDFVFDDIAEIERKVLTREIAPDAARVLIWSKQWRAARLAQKRYGDRVDVNSTHTIDVAGRIVSRWKENLAELALTEASP